MPYKIVPKGYSSWIAMRARCSRPNSAGWKDYGGRGIKVCDRWQVFANFIADMGEPAIGLSIDRIDVNGNYEPANCKWSTRFEQQANKRNNVIVNIQGTAYKLVTLTKMTSVTPQTIQRRAKSGVRFDEVIDPSPKSSLEWSMIGRAKWSALASEKIKCANGHDFTESNTYITKQGWKRCRDCHNAKMRRLNAAKRSTS